MPDQPDYLKPYARAIETHGPTFEATLWLNRQKQTDRFRVFTQMMNLAGRTIVDAGCGLGDLAAYLDLAGIHYARYLGLEAIPQMYDQARTRTLPRAHFFNTDFAQDEQCFDKLAKSEKFDVAVFSGSLNTFDEGDARAIVGRAFAALPPGGCVMFNFLSTRHWKTHAPDPYPARRFDPVKMVEFALGQTPLVVMRQDYMAGHDATVGMVKPTP